MTVVTVVVDTNVLLPLLRSSRPPWVALLERARAKEIALVVPELVWREVAAVDRERLVEAHRTWMRAGEALSKLGVQPPEWAAGELDSAKASAGVVKAFRHAFEQAGGRTCRLPEVSHSDLVERAISRRRPFDDEGHNGYRDALLWESVTTFVADGARVVLVSNDARAFAASKRSSALHPDLLHDVRERMGPGGSAELVRSVGKAAELVTERTEATRALLGRLLEGDLAAELMQVVAERLDGYELDRTELRRPGWAPVVVAARIQEVTGLQTIGVLSALPQPDGRVAAEIGIGYTVDVTLLMEPDLPETAYQFISAEPQMEGEGRGLLDSFDRLTVTRDVYVYADAVVEPKLGRVDEAKITLVDVPRLYSSHVAGQMRLELG